MLTSASSLAAEEALRVATNTSSRDLSDLGTQASKMKERADGIIASGNHGTTISPQSALQQKAIEAAFLVVAVACSAIDHAIQKLSYNRSSFDKEREAGIATFMIPNNKEETDLSKEEKVMKDFFGLVMSYPAFSKYLGIHSADLSTDKTAKFYSVLPFYRMSEALAQPLSSSKPLDRQRTAIGLFFRSAMPDAMAEIDHGFQLDSRFLSFWKSLIQGRNYLNDRRAPRFLMICLSNLIWNLQHPVDPETGYALTITRRIEMCRLVELFLNQLLDERSRPYLSSINNCENHLMSFLRKLEVYTKGLRAAFVHEQLHEVNFDDITNKAHETLRIMVKGLFKLIYKKYNPITKKNEPDDKAAETLADLISYINVLLSENPNLLRQLSPIPTWIPKDAGLQRPLKTMIDVLIVFCHLSWRERHRILETLSKSSIPSEIEFYGAVQKLESRFIKPIRTVCKEELGTTSCSPKSQLVGELTARRLMPFITLVIEDYGLVADTPATHLTGKQQVQNINVMAQKGDKKNTYYYWELSPYTKGTQALDELPKYLYRMTQVTQLMDGVRELVENYRTFLLKKEFQSFLLRCLDKVSGEIAQLDAHVDEADQCLDESKSVSRGLMDILRNLTKALDASLEGFRGAMVDFKKVVSAPDFIKKQHLRLNMKVSKVAEQYQVLFNENSGLTDLLVLMDPSDEPQASSDETKLKKPLSQHVISPPDVHPALPNHLADPGQMRALKRTVKMCYDALSFQSRVGRKGLLLQKLLESIEHRSHVTEQYIKYVVMELTRVTASERETWFFQAEYGKTRSAKALMMAIKDSTINQALPLAVMILGQPVSDIAAVSEGQIIRRFKQLRASHSRWQESSHHMNIEPFQETLEDRKVGFSVR